MYIFATFEQSNHLELAITDIERMGLPKYKILAIPLDKRVEKPRLFDSIHRSDGVSLLDVPAIIGTITMLLGVIYGFILPWGPVIWGLISLVFGLIIGFLIKILFTKVKLEKPTLNKKQVSEVILMLHCKEELSERIKDVLWEHNAYGMAYLNSSTTFNNETNYFSK